MTSVIYSLLHKNSQNRTRFVDVAIVRAPSDEQYPSTLTIPQVSCAVMAALAPHREPRGRVLEATCPGCLSSSVPLLLLTPFECFLH